MRLFVLLALLFALTATEATAKPFTGKLRYWRRSYDVMTAQYGGREGIHAIPVRLDYRVSLAKLAERYDCLRVTTGCYFDSITLDPIDFYWKQDILIKERAVGRPVLWVRDDGAWGITKDIRRYLHDPRIVLIVALGETVCPQLSWDRDGLSGKAARRARASWRRRIGQVTERQLIGFSVKGSRVLVHLVSARCTPPEARLFMANKLGCYYAVNCDGGSSVRWGTRYPILWYDNLSDLPAFCRPLLPQAFGK